MAASLLLLLPESVNGHRRQAFRRLHKTANPAAIRREQEAPRRIQSARRDHVMMRNGHYRIAPDMGIGFAPLCTYYHIKPPSVPPSMSRQTLGDCLPVFDTSQVASRNACALANGAAATVESCGRRDVCCTYTLYIVRYAYVYI